MGQLVSKFWSSQSHSFPILSDLASRILNIPVSSSIIERTFSKISRFCTKEKNRIKSKTLATFVGFNEFQDFEPNMMFLFKKYNLPYESLSWVAIDEDPKPQNPDYMEGLIDENDANSDDCHSDSDDFVFE